MKLKPLFVLSAAAPIAICCNASRTHPLSSAVGRGPEGQQQSEGGTKSFSDASERITFSYPATYVVDNAAAARLQKQWDLNRASTSEAHPAAHLVAYLTDKHNDAHIIIMVEDSPFDLEDLRKGAPTGMSDWYWLKFTEFGENRFYFYRGGNQSVQHPDAFFYDLNNKILSFTFDGPYPENSPLPDFRKLGPVEQTVLTSLKTPVKQAFSTPPGGFLYTNDRYGFQLTLNRAWKGYQVSEQREPSNDITYLVFSVPASETSVNRINLIYIGVQSTEAWEKRVIQCGCGANSALSLQLYEFVGATVIGRTSSTVFSLESKTHDDELRTKYQLDQVIESFRLLS